MRKYFIVFLAFIFCFSTVALDAVAEPTVAGHNHCNKQNRHRHSHGYSGNCSNSKVLTYVENFDETTPFAACKDHSLVTHTKILHYSDGSTDAHYRYGILDSNGGIIADNLYHAKHFINSQDKHYFIIKSPDYNKKNYVIMDEKGNVSKTEGYSKYKILGKDNIIVQRNRKYGVVDFDNNVILDIKYKSIRNYDNILVTKFNGYYGLADNLGNIILNNEYDKISKYGNIFILKYKDKYGVADLTGKILYTPSFDSIKKDGDYLKIKKDGKYGIIDTNGNLVAPIKYKKVRIKRNTPQIYQNKEWF